MPACLSFQGTRTGSLAESGEIEWNDDVLAVGSEHFDGGVRRVDIPGLILQPDIPADETATVSLIRAVAVGRAVVEGGWSNKR